MLLLCKPFQPPTVLPIVVFSLVEFRCQLAYQTRIWIAINWMQYPTSHVAVLRLCFCHKMAPEAIPEHLISIWRGMPSDPLDLHAYMHAYIHIRQPCNPPSENSGHGPDIICKVSIWENNFFFFKFAFVDRWAPQAEVYFTWSYVERMTSVDCAERKHFHQNAQRYNRT